MINLQKLFSDTFDPQPGETALVLIDTPHGAIGDTPAWEQRRAMAQRWHAALCELGAAARLSGAGAGQLSGHGIAQCTAARTWPAGRCARCR